MRHCIFIITLLLGFSSAMCAVGHDSPNEVIDALSHTIEDEGATATLLVARAYEYRAYGDMDSAEADLKAALELEVSHGSAYISLGQLYLHLNRIQETLSVVHQGLKQDSSADVQAALNSIRAESLVIQKKWLEALEAIELALQFSSSELEWVLLKSQILRGQMLRNERVDYLQKASLKNISIVLSIELVGGLRDAGRYTECLDLIDTFVEKRNLKAEWLLRRAEVYMIMGRNPSMRVDALRALSELNERLNVAKPDEHLYTEREKAIVYLEIPDSTGFVTGGEHSDEHDAILPTVISEGVSQIE